MAPSKPVTMHVAYVPKKGREEELRVLVEKHWPTLDRIGLVTKQPPRIWKAADKKSGRVFYVEVFQWKDEQASSIAHQTPEVMAIWEPMGPLLDDLQLAQVERMDLPFAAT